MLRDIEFNIIYRVELENKALMSSVFDTDKIKRYGFAYGDQKVKIRLKSFREMISNDFFSCLLLLRLFQMSYK